MAFTITISLTKEQKDFLNESGMSPSAIMQRAIDEIIERRESFTKERNELCARIQGLRNELQKRIDFIENKNLIEEFEKQNV